MNNTAFRAEYKYFVPLILFPYIFSDIKKFTNTDKHSLNSNGYYTVSSIYFENEKKQFYLDKVDGLAERIKFRLRFYLDIADEFYFVELKSKLYDRYLKRRIITTINNHFRLVSHPAKNEVLLEDEILRRFSYYKKFYNFIPFIRINYQRYALYDKINNNVRITFDQNIKCCRYWEGQNQIPYIPTLPSDIVVMEVKTKNVFPYWLLYIIKKYSLRRSAISKYVYSVQRLTYNSTFSI